MLVVNPPRQSIRCPRWSRSLSAPLVIETLSCPFDGSQSLVIDQRYTPDEADLLRSLSVVPVPFRLLSHRRNSSIYPFHNLTTPVREFVLSILESLQLALHELAGR